MSKMLELQLLTASLQNGLIYDPHWKFRSEQPIAQKKRYKRKHGK